MRGRGSPCRPRAGLTLVEVLVALAIVGLACALLATSQAFHAGLLRRLDADTRAIGWARDQLEATRASRATTACMPGLGDDGGSSTPTCSVEVAPCDLGADACALLAAAAMPVVRIEVATPRGGQASARVASMAAALDRVVEAR